MPGAASHATPRTAYAGRAYRQCHPDYADLAETVRAGAAYPARFTPPGGRFGVLYVALTPDTAVAELRRRAALAGVPVGALAPRVLLTLDARLARVLDLGDPATRDAWGLTAADLAGDDYARCQEVAAAARAAGYEAVRYPSATGAGENLAVFYDRLHPGSGVRVVGREPLSLDDD